LLGESVKRWKGVSPSPSIEPKPSKGHQTLEPSIGHQTLEPSKGHQTLDDTLPTPWGTKMWVPNRKQHKSKESGHAP